MTRPHPHFGRRPRRHRLRPSAILLLELLIALGILATFALAATQLFHVTVRASHASAQQQDAAASFESAVGVLRGDVWVAGEIAVPDPSTAKLGKVTWSIQETRLTRDAGDASPARTWPMPKGVTFATDGGALVLRVPAARGGERGGDVRMISQITTLTRLTSP